jgi:hypothetical protein
MDAQAWLHLHSFPHHFWIVHTTWISARDKQLSPYTCLINSSLSCSFPEFKTYSLSAPCHYCDHVLSLPAQYGAVFPVLLSVGRCGVGRLQKKVGHMDGMHCFIAGTSILVKIKSVSLYNCQKENCSEPSISCLFDVASRKQVHYQHIAPVLKHKTLLHDPATFRSQPQGATILKDIYSIILRLVSSKMYKRKID